MFPITALHNAFISILHKFNSWCTQYYKNPFIVNSPQYYLPLIYGCLSPSNTTSSFQIKTKMTSPQNWFNEVPSFDLGIDNNSKDISLLVVEDSLDGDRDTNLIQDTLFEGEVMRSQQSKHGCLKM